MMDAVRRDSIATCFILVLLISLAGGCTVLSTCPPSTASRGVVTDPPDNLRGDLDRRFLDVVAASVRREAGGLVFEAVTQGALPRPAEMSGGRRADFIWFLDVDRDAATGATGTGSDLHLHAWISEEGWRPSLFRLSRGADVDGACAPERDLGIRVAERRVEVVVPDACLPGESFDWWLATTTANAVDWAPSTWNPDTRRASFPAPG